MSTKAKDSVFWYHQIFDCFNDCGNCLCGSCCMPCQMADSADRLDENSGLFCLMTLFVPCIPIFLLRRKMRNRFGIEGSSTRDTLSAWCCPVCASCQIANELDERRPTVPDEFSHEVFKY